MKHTRSEEDAIIFNRQECSIGNAQGGETFETECSNQMLADILKKIMYTNFDIGSYQYGFQFNSLGESGSRR